MNSKNAHPLDLTRWKPEVEVGVSSRIVGGGSAKEIDRSSCGDEGATQTTDYKVGLNCFSSCRILEIP